MQNQPNDFDQQEALVVADNWKAVGLKTDVHRLSTSELRDNELRSTYSGVQYGRTGFTLEAMPWLSAQISRPENRWSGQNRSAYVNPVLEDLWPKVLGAVDAKEREALLVPALQSMMDDAVVALTHQQPNIMVSNADLVGPQLSEWPLWNVWEWSWK
jgi:ABC-type transport system substrate-binding protein